MIIIEKAESNEKQKTSSKEFISDTLCYTQSKGGNFVYLLEDEMLYVCNHDAKLLEVMNIDSKRNQVELLKNLLPDFKIERADIGSEEKITIKEI